MQPQTPTEPLPIAQVNVGMTVVDATGEEVGTVTAVQMPGTDGAGARASCPIQPASVN
jgi:hypothetical protein